MPVWIQLGQAWCWNLFDLKLNNLTFELSGESRAHSISMINKSVGHFWNSVLKGRHFKKSLSHFTLVWLWPAKVFLRRKCAIFINEWKFVKLKFDGLRKSQKLLKITLRNCFSWNGRFSETNSVHSWNAAGLAAYCCKAASTQFSKVT